jgi:hypothetical protein
VADRPPLEPMVEPPFDPPPPPPPIQPESNRLPAIVGLAVILALLASVLGIFLNRGDDDSDTTASIPTTSTTDVAPSTTVDTTPPSKTEIADVVEEISAFVADARGLEYKHKVTVDLLDDAAFSDRVRKDAVDDLKSLEETEGVLRALGLLEKGVHLADALQQLLGDSVVGFYDPKTDELVVRGAAITPYVRLTLAHELTHALDDQHFELDRPDLDEADDETGTGFSALVEGNALRIEDEYRDTLTDDERQQADDEEARLGASIDLSSLPRVLPEIVAFPYAFGPGLLDALVAKGGEAEVNRAFDRPPMTSEQVIDPQSWISGDRAATELHPAKPKADGKIIDQGVLGMWGIVLLLEDELGQQGAAPVAQGWGGDWYVAWERGDEVCVRNTLVMDTASDLDELASALDQWAAGQPDAEVEQADGSVTYTACG